MSDADATAWPVSPRTDLISALLLVLVGAYIVVTSWRMDRLEQQGATLYSAPGLWPGIVGFLLVTLAATLAWRSVQRARRAGWHAAEADDAVLAPRGDFYLAVASFLFYALALVGRGVPFWLGTALFVAAFVFLFRRAEGQATTARSVAVALACGILTSLVVTIVFEQLFFVRLP